jgi:ABC-type transporter Mla subunit MlaD
VNEQPKESTQGQQGPPKQTTTATQQAPAATTETGNPVAATVKQLQQAEKNIENRMSAFERTMIRLTRAGVIIGVITLLIFAGQLYEMIEGGTATDKLVDYSKVQANASSDQADAAQQFSDTAEDINGRMSDAVDQLQAAAANAKSGITATQDAMRLD